MFRSFFASKEYFWKAWGVGTLLVLLTLFNVWVNLQIGKTIGVLSIMLKNSDRYAFIDYTSLIGQFLACAGAFFLTDAPTYYFAKMFALDWRQAITESFVPRWEKVVGKTKLKGISQRLQEEPGNFAKFFDSMGFQVLHSFCVVWGFSYELTKVGPTIFYIKWSADVHIGILSLIAVAVVVKGIVSALFFERRFHFRSLLIALFLGCVFSGTGPTILSFLWLVHIPIGWFPIISFTVFAVGLIGAIFIGYSFPRMENHNRDTEAALRHNYESVELGKVPYDKEALLACFCTVYYSYKRYFRRVIPLDGWKSIYWNSIGIIPWIVGGYWVFPHIIEYEQLAPILYNFAQYMGAWSFFINNWRSIVDFIATLRRLQALEAELDGDYIVPIEASSAVIPESISNDSFVVYRGESIPITPELALAIENMRKH